MSFFPPVDFVITVVAGEAIAKFGEINAELAVMEKRALAAGTSLGTVEKGGMLAKAGLAVAGVAMFEFGKLALEATSKTQEAFARMDVALKNTGNGSKELTKQLHETAEANTALGFSVPETANALGSLVQATGNVKDSQKLLTLAMDVARNKHMSLSETATILARGTQGAAKAFKEFGITLDTSLPKQQAINKAMDELSAKTKGDNAAWLKTFPGQLSVISAEFEKITASVGKSLVPVLEKLGKIIGGIIKFFKDNADALKALTVVVGVGVALWKSYEITILAVNAVQKIQIALALASAEGIGAMKAAQLLLNDAMRANAIGLIVTALMAVGAAFIWAWNHSETFRKVVVTGLQIVIDAFGYLVGAIGTAFKLMSHLPVIGGMFKGISKAIDEGANSIRKFSDGLDKLKTKKDAIEKPSTSTTDTNPFALDSYTGAVKKPKVDPNIKKLQDDNKKLEGYYKDMNTVVSDYLDARNKLVEEKNSRDSAAQASFNEAQYQADRTFNDDKFKLDRDSNQKLSNLYRSFNEANAASQQTYDDAMATAKKNNNEALFKIQRSYDDAVTAATQQAADKRQSIIQKSIDMLTGAFANATGFDIGSVFASMLPKDNKAITNALFNQVKDGVKASTSWWGTSQETGISGLLDKLKAQLTGAKTLADDAAKLAAQGYSQTFIQEVVAQGPDVGGQLAQSILGATPETQAQLQSLYGQVKDVSENGMTALATQMSDSTHLATKALTDEYAQVAIELQKSLSDANKTMETAKADQLTKFTDEQANALKTLNESKARAQQTLDDALKDEAISYANSLFDMNTNHKNAMRDANKALQDAITASQTQFNKDVDTLAADTKKKLDALLAQIQAVAAAMAALGGGFGGGSVGPVKPPIRKVVTTLRHKDGSVTTYYSDGTTETTTPPAVVAPITLPNGAVSNPGGKFVPAAGAPQIVINQDITNTGTDTSATTAATLAALKYGSPLAGTTSAVGN